jgi:HPr Serine kinase C-terminal domain
MSFAYHHYGFGLNFQSAIPLPEMRMGASDDGEIITIQLGVADRPAGLIDTGLGIFAGPNDVWMEVPEVVRLRVSNGNYICIEPAPYISMGDVRAYLLGTAIGALLHQRGLLPLHASAVEVNGVAIAFCGPSGAGKSTMALHLVKHGYRLLCDDICAIDLSSGTPLLWPGLVNLKLWRETLDASGESADGLEAVVHSIDKYRRPVAELAAYKRYDLTHIFMLERSNNQLPTIDPIKGAQGVAQLVTNTFRGQVVTPMQLQRRHFGQCVTTAQSVTQAKLSRHWDLGLMTSICAAVEEMVMIQTAR